MANKKQEGKKTITEKRMKEIQNYLLSINGLINPNMKDATRMNPIAVETAKQALELIKGELSLYEIDIQMINLDAIYGEEDRTEIDWLICGLNDGFVKASYYTSYKDMIRGEALEEMYPEEERKLRIKELENEIHKQMQIAKTMEKISPTLAKKKEQEADMLSKEMESVQETLQLPTREYLRAMLYSNVTYKLQNLKEQCNYKLDYLKGVLA